MTSETTHVPGTVIVDLEAEAAMDRSLLSSMQTPGEKKIDMMTPTVIEIGTAAEGE